MENNAELVRLEQFIDKLLTKYNELKGRYHALETTLQERDDECAQLKSRVADLSDERSEVGSRVSGLLGRIEEWEASHGSEEQGGVQGSLFDNESETDA